MRKQLYRMMKLGVAATLSLACSDAFAATLTDDANTIGLWHMDSLDSMIVVDDDSYSGGARGNDLTAYGTVSLVTFGHDGTGGALDFAGGSGDKLTANGIWPLGDIPGFFLDLRFQLDAVSGNQIIAKSAGFAITLGDSGDADTRIRMVIYGEDSNWYVDTAWDAVATGQWYHLQAGLDGALNPTLMLDGVEVGTISGTPNAIQDSASGWFDIGQYVDGRIDEVQLSSIPEPSALSLSIAIGLLVACRRTRR